jgi:hypothetical protein
MNNEIKELEIENGENEKRKFYKRLETLTKTYKLRIINMKAHYGSVFTDEIGILDSLNGHFKGEQSAQPFEFYENESYDYNDEETKEPTPYEIQKIIRNLKRMKAPGNDNINAELLQAAGPQMTQRIQEIILKIWRYERMCNE